MPMRPLRLPPLLERLISQSAARRMLSRYLPWVTVLPSQSMASAAREVMATGFWPFALQVPSLPWDFLSHSSPLLTCACILSGMGSAEPRQATMAATPKPASTNARRGSDLMATPQRKERYAQKTIGQQHRRSKPDFLTQFLAWSSL